MRRPSAGLLLVGWLALLHPSQAQIMSVDLGHEFFKVALMRQGKPLEIVLNTHSKRKSCTATSFFEAVRIFGDDALAHQGKAPAKVPMFFHSLMGRNFTSDDVKAGGRWWGDFGLGDRFYSFNLGYEEERGVPTMLLEADNATDFEEVLASVFHFARQITEDSSEGKAVKDVVVTMPYDATLRQRQAIVAAGEIAGLRVLTLVHEGSAFAVQRAVDFTPEKGTTEITLFYNIGSRKAEVTIVKFDSRSAGMVAGKTAPVVTVLGSAIDFGIGGHLMDLKIAEVMLKKFQEKFPKLAAGVQESPRALRKLLSQAQKTKAILSSNKAAPFNVESLFEDTDFQTTIKREDFEGMCQEMFGRLTPLVEKALKAANVTMPEVNSVEVVGGGWRVPRVQQLLSEFFDSGREKKLPLGQHLNGEEAAALGAALVAANSSSSFRVKKIFFSDITAHEYSVQVVALNGAWERNVTVLYPVGTPLGGKKKLSFSLEEDFAIRLFEDGVLLTEYAVTGLAELLEGKWKEYNLTGPPKISATVPLETSGLVEVKTPTATVEEVYWVNVTKEKPKAFTNTSMAANGTNGSNTTEEANATAAAAPEASPNASANETANASAAEFEVVQKQKKKKHEKKLTVKRTEFRPIPLTEDRIAAQRKKLEQVAQREAEFAAVAGLKNELEASIYGSREKVEREDIIKVSTEQHREEVSKLCTEFEEWMYEAGATKSDYEAKLASLQDLLGPMEERAMELEARSDLPDSVREGVDGMVKVSKFIEANMSWVSANKTEAAQKKLDEFREWWKKKQEQQEGLPLHEAPAFTKKEVIDRLTKIQKSWDTLKKTKKPKEKAKPKQAKNDTAGNGTSAPAGEDAAEPVDAKFPSDPAAVEKEIAAVREQKSSAVENEDFDKAHALKEKEQALVKHLQKLNAQKTEL